MYLMRIGEPGAEVPVIGDDEGRHFDARPLAQDIDGAFLMSGGIQRARERLRARDLPPFAVEGRRVGPPIAPPRAVVCIGQNYAAHAAESGNAPPKHPVVFLKHPNTVVGPNDDVRIPPGATHVDWEVELGVVIGRRARYLRSTEEAVDHIAGLTMSNDVSERAYQLELSGGQWSKGKCCETFNPLGPWLRPVDEFTDVQDLRLRSRVNDHPRQDSSTKDMIFPVAEIVRELSQFMILEPGDLINTGTPQGVALSGRYPYLAVGDTMEMEIEGLGVQRQRLVAAQV